MTSARSFTIDDVARLAGVSVATVSRALRGLPNVAPSTRARVKEVADQLDYRPDPLASRLAAGRTNTVAMAVPSLDSWYFSQVMSAAESMLTTAGYDLLLFCVDGEQSRRRLTQGPLVKRADGLIVVDLNLSSVEVASLAAAGVEVVTVGTQTTSLSSVRIDDVRVAEVAVAHLVELGHRRVALLAGMKDDPMHFDVPRLRWLGYHNTLTASGIDVDPELERAGNFSVAGGREAMTELLGLADQPTAVFAMSDEMAFGAMQAILEHGLDIPGDISIVGVDDHELAPVLGLTTVAQDVRKHGAYAAEMLLHRLDRLSSDPDHTEVRIELVIRTTTSPPPQGPTSTGPELETT